MSVKKHRGVNVDFWTDEKVVALSPLARLLFLGSWHYCCDSGHLDASPLELKLKVLPADNCDPEELVAEILAQGLFVQVDGLLSVPKLPEHQKIDKRYAIRCERCVDNGSSPEPPASPPRGPRVVPEGTRAEGDGEGDGEGEGVETPTSADADAPPRTDVERLCRRLADRIEANGSKRPRITKGWRDAARLMLDRDGYTEEQIARCIDWCQSDEFWRGNVLSMPTLRKQYDRLRLAAQRGKSEPSTYDPDLPDWMQA